MGNCASVSGRVPGEQRAISNVASLFGAFYQLPSDLVISILFRWLYLRDVGRLDSACSCYRLRPWFLNTIRLQYFDGESRVFKDDKIWLFIKWAASRQILLRCEQFTRAALPSKISYIHDTDRNSIRKLRKMVMSNNMSEINIGCFVLAMKSAHKSSRIQPNSRWLREPKLMKTMIKLSRTRNSHIQKLALCTGTS